MFYVYMLWTLYVRFTYPYLAMVQIGTDTQGQSRSETKGSRNRALEPHSDTRGRVLFPAEMRSAYSTTQVNRVDNIKIRNR